MFTNETRSRIVTVNLKSKTENTYNVDVFLRNINISELLIKNKLATRDLESFYEDTGVFKQFERPKDIKFSTSANVTCIYSPYCFYIQEITDEFAEFEQNMQAYYQRNFFPLTNPQIGMACMAKYSENQSWYRATIKEIDHAQKLMRVFFVDYGDEDLFPLDEHAKNICELRDEFKAFPTMGVKCSLIGIEPSPTCKYNANKIMDIMFSELGSTVAVKFVDQAEDFYFVEIAYKKWLTEEISAFVNLRDFLVEKNCAQYIDADTRVNAKEGKSRRSSLLNISQLETILEDDSGDFSFKQFY